jgi:hypothetical protein
MSRAIPPHDRLANIAGRSGPSILPSARPMSALGAGAAQACQVTHCGAGGRINPAERSRGAHPAASTAHCDIPAAPASGHADDRLPAEGMNCR